MTVAGLRTAASDRERTDRATSNHTDLETLHGAVSKMR